MVEGFILFWDSGTEYPTSLGLDALHNTVVLLLLPRWSFDHTSEPRTYLSTTCLSLSWGAVVPACTFLMLVEQPLLVLNLRFGSEG